MGSASKNKNKNWSKFRKHILIDESKFTVKNKSIYLQADVRKKLIDFPDSSIDCVITSPPYGNLKNYGTKKQLGYGQDTRNEYFPDMEALLTELYRVIRKGSSMWIVLDNMKLNGVFVPLPWEIINIATEVGWALNDVIVWDKGKSLPWSHKGRFRSVSENILLFSKDKISDFNIDSVRETEGLSNYWIKYPERYHPDGKAPSDIWHFPIPTQGSWAQTSEQSRHYCPFPVELVGRMLLISTKEEDIVLDPFAGTGSVLAAASYLNRNSIGIDTNKRFQNQFNKTGFNTYIRMAEKAYPRKNLQNTKLRELIIKLRMLKYTKVLFDKLSRVDHTNGLAGKQILVLMVNLAKMNSTKANTINTLDLGEIDIYLIFNKNEKIRSIKNLCNELINVPPLSKYGLKANLNMVSFNSWKKPDYLNAISEGSYYQYNSGRFYKFDRRILNRNLHSVMTSGELNTDGKIPPILSNIKVDCNYLLGDN